MPNTFDSIIPVRGGVNVNQRLKEIRKVLKISQEQFGKKLGVTGAGISKIESGDRALTEQMLLSVCRVYDVNENWLRTGEGEMFDQLNRDEELAKWAGSLVNPNNDNEFIKKFVHILSKLDIEDWKIIEKIVTLMVEENKKD